jgi:hypothetical protein
VSISHTNSSIRPSVMPGQRIDAAVAVVPIPASAMPRIQ